MPDVTQSPLPDPLTPSSCDLRGLEDMPINVQWMRDLPVAANATGDEFRAAILLMFASWHQCPSGSLPNDDRQLGFLAGFGRGVKGFLKVKERALNGWVLCSDNRWYHPVIAEAALRAWSKKRDSDARKGRRAKSARVAANARWSPSLVARGDKRENDLVPDEAGPSKAGVDKEIVSPAGSGRSALSLSSSQDPEVPSRPETELALEDADGNSKRRKKARGDSVVSKKDLRAALLDGEFPEWLPKDVWEQYVDHRFELRKPLTIKARDAAIRTLEKLRNEGNDPAEVMEASIVSGWAGLFPVKKGKGAARHRTTGSLFDGGDEKRAPLSVVTRL